MIIAVDGPAASGKGTLARRLAVHYGLPYLDTGTLYRGVARDMLDAGADLHDTQIAKQYAELIDPETFSDARIRRPEIGAAASIVAKHDAVRQALLLYQRQFAYQSRGAVLDGRDIGTVICPDASVKLFVTASLKERSRRRHAELKIRGEAVTLGQVEAEIAARDKQDSSRLSAPLKQADDSHFFDTTHLDIETTFQRVVRLIDTKISEKTF
ncbi:MAG: (d)CMP kinase [Pseudomonadota bacterium]